MNELIRKYDNVIECAEGWYNILLPILRYVEHYNENHDDSIVIYQIKEKFGGLRVYCNFYTVELNEIIDKAEDLSWKTCEVCGSTEDTGLQLTSWMVTKCRNCVQHHANYDKKPILWQQNSTGNQIYITPIIEQNDENFIE